MLNGLIKQKKINQLFDTTNNVSFKWWKLIVLFVMGNYGDNCEKCSATYDAVNYRTYGYFSTKPIIKESDHLFFALKEQIINWLNNSNIQDMQNKLNEWLKRR